MSPYLPLFIAFLLTDFRKQHSHVDPCDAYINSLDGLKNEFSGQKIFQAKGMFGCLKQRQWSNWQDERKLIFRFNGKIKFIKKVLDPLYCELLLSSQLHLQSWDRPWAMWGNRWDQYLWGSVPKQSFRNRYSFKGIYFILLIHVLSDFITPCSKQNFHQHFQHFPISFLLIYWICLSFNFKGDLGIKCISFILTT